VTAKINETDIRLILDSGATTNILDSASFDRIQKNNAKLQLEPTSIKIYPYNSRIPLPTTGKFEVQFCNGAKTTCAKFHVLKGILGHRWDMRQQQNWEVSARIEELEALDIIERASGLTSWVSPVVAAPKSHNPSEVQVCGDYRNFQKHCLGTRFYFSDISVSNVALRLQNLKASKATGVDNIPAKVLKAASHIIAPSLTVIFKQSLSTGIYIND
jgi:hypothetical protein